MALPRPLSHSSMSLYAECPQKYKFKYVDKIPEKPRHFFSFGTSVHGALEFFYGVKALPAPSLEEVLRNYKENWIAAGYKDKIQEAEYFEDGRQILEGFYKKHISDFQIPYFVEYQFNLEVEGVPVTGRVDRVDKTPEGKLWVTDYKTGKALASDRVLTDAQLTLYQMACEELLGAPVERLSFYHLPSLKEQIVSRHTEEAVRGLRRKITDTAESISRGLFEPSPGEQKCRWCDYKPLCPVFKNNSAPWKASAVLKAPAEKFESSPGLEPDSDIAFLIDSYGEILDRVREVNDEARELKEKILAAFEKKKFVRAFGKEFEATLSETARWEFSDKKKVIEAIKKAGLYDRVLAPSAPKVEAVMEDATLPEPLKAELAVLGKKTTVRSLEITPLS